MKTDLKANPLTTTLLLALILAFPSAAQAEDAKPAVLDPAIDACAQCKMSVKDSGYAAQVIAGDGRVYKFDDIGCLLTYLSANPSVKAAARYVQDSSTHAWVALEKAYYVVTKEVPTPMSYGIHAFASKAAAASFAQARKDGAKVVALADLKIEDAPDSDMKM